MKWAVASVWLGIVVFAFWLGILILIRTAP
jgi:hypothetical protein